MFMFARTEHKHRTPSDIQLKDDDSHQLANPYSILRQKCFPSDSNVTFVPMIFGGERGMDNCGEEICGGDIPEEYEV